MGSVKLLKASAGSGKTYRLAYEYVRVIIAEPWQYKHILAVTFTNKATEEMKSRIVAEINDLARGVETSYMKLLRTDLEMEPDEIRRHALMARTRILHDYSHFAILTIDKFFQRIIRSFIKELGLDLNFNLELRTGSLLSRACDMLIDEISLNPAVREWITSFVEEKIGENRQWDIKSELAQLGREIFREHFGRSPATGVSKEELGKIVARAGYGAHEIVNSLKATAKQALEIIAGNNLSISDFAYGNSGFAGYFARIAQGNIVAYGTRVEEALGSENKWYAKTSPRRDEIRAAIPLLHPLLRELCDGYDKHYRFLNNVELIRRNYRNFALLTDLARNLEAIYASDNILPISETNHILHQLITHNDTPFIFEKTGNHFNRFMIDEFQDTSALQWENFLPLLHNALSQSDSVPVLLVGDVKQSIYRWRGGDWRILASAIEKEFAELSTINLSTNYRSSGNIVEFNNHVIDSVVRADNDILNNAIENAQQEELIGSQFRVSLEDTLRTAYDRHHQTAASGEGQGYVSVTVYPKQEESEDVTAAIPPIISRIEDLQARGYSPGDIAILVRANKDAVKIAAMMLEYKRGNPHSPYSYDIVTQEAMFIASAEVIGFIMACFKLTCSPRESVSLALYNRWLSLPVGQALDGPTRGFIETLCLMSPQEAYEAVSMRYGLHEKQSHIAYLQAFHEQILSFTSTSIGDLQLFIKWWDENGANASVVIPASDSAITISSIHKAKGLQYKVVIIPYCNWRLSPLNNSVIWVDAGKAVSGLGSMPLAFNDKMRKSHFAEDYYNELVMSHVDNVNIFYVAVTRAIEELHIMMPADNKRRENQINTLVIDAVSTFGPIRKSSDEAGYQTYESGNPTRHESNYNKRNINRLHPSYVSYPIANRLKLKVHTERYYQDDSHTGLSPRDYGISMHRAFESATDNSHIIKSIGLMEANGELSPEESAALHVKIAHAFENPLVNSWFNDDWDSIRNENDIIVPGSFSSSRPDRVMIKGSHAVVVDYKFGSARRTSYRRQIQAYTDLLKQMKYTDIEAYIWYVSLDRIEKVV